MCFWAVVFLGLGGLSRLSGGGRAHPLVEQMAQEFQAALEGRSEVEQSVQLAGVVYAVAQDLGGHEFAPLRLPAAISVWLPHGYTLRSL